MFEPSKINQDDCWSVVIMFPDKDLVINYAFMFRIDEAPSWGSGYRIENANKIEITKVELEKVSGGWVQ